MIILSIILTIREEIVCFLFLVFLICYYSFYKNNDENSDRKPFLKISFFALGHVIFDIVTVITVNNISIVPGLLNRILHIVYFCFGVLFIVEFLDYVILLTMSNKFLQKYRRTKFLSVILVILLSFILPLEYVEGRGTNYSFGPFLFACYGIFALYCITSVVLIIVHFKKLDKKMRLAVFPTTILMALMISTQVVVPELLMTGAGATFVCIGLFVTVENPVSEYLEQALWDNSTGLRNKNSFGKQMSVFEKKYRNKQLNIGFIICDMNGLKLINDNYGHAEGDRLIKAVAMILTDNLKNAYNVYRIGGDEFAVIYISPNDKIVNSEVENVRTACNNYKDSPIKLSIAMGYASGTGNFSEFMKIYNRADNNMYENKAAIKKLNPQFCR
ncbi:GGDEF domain-containing protein [Porcipelethomonas sp.]|uniref:GGDEF domain-containing protein n=1 Tax=Porcipelethomonas sp. TaxID=2981675 RepID=UPI003EF4B6AF